MANETQAPAKPSPLSGAKIWLLFFLLICVGLLGWSFFPPRWPGPDAQPNVAKGIDRKCDVTRDKFNVPHIKATSMEASVYCWGRIQALDRGWQIDFLRRRGYGRVAEVYGMKHAKDDFQMRILDLAAVADKWILYYQRKSPKILKLLQYYVWGINDGFAVLKDPKRTPYMWKKIGYHPPAWRIRDTLVIIVLQSFYQTQRSFTDDLKHARLRVKLGPIRYQQLFQEKGGLRPLAHTIIKPGEFKAVRFRFSGAQTKPGTRRAAPSSKPTAGKEPSKKPQTRKPGASRPAVRKPVTRPQVPAPRLPPASVPVRRAVPEKRAPVPRRTERTPLHKARLARLAALDDLIAYFAPHAEIGGGSNNWVVAPQRTTNGHALLANDPHLGIGTPSFWHEVHIQAPGLNVLGIGVPGTPALVSGNNTHVAWGITNGFSNAADLIRIRPDRKGRFKLGGKKYQVRSFRPVVWIKRGPIHFPVFWKSFGRTALGPILPIGSKPGEVILFRWTGYHIEKPPLDAPLAIMKSRSVKEIDKAFQRFTMPCWNFVFADTKGGIGYRQVGLVAKRAKGARGLVNGSDPKQLWQGFLTTKEMPHLLNPGRGFIATANNHAFPKGYPYYLGQAYINGHRAKRIETLIKKTPKHTFKTMQQIQLDIEVPMARLLLSKMLARVDRTSLPKAASAALVLLKSWDLRAHRDAIAPTLFRVWIRALEERLFAHDIVIPSTPRRRSQTSALSRQKAFRPGDAALLGVFAGKVEINVRVSLPKALRDTLLATTAKLTRQLGSDMQKWRWGRYHKLGFFHMLGKWAPSRPKPEAMHGGVETVSPALLRGDGPFWVKNAASYRLIVELKPGRIRSWGVLAGKNIDDKPKTLGAQQRLWLDHKYRPRPFYPDEIKKFHKSHRVISF